MPIIRVSATEKYLAAGWLLLLTVLSTTMVFIGIVSLAENVAAGEMIYFFAALPLLCLGFLLSFLRGAKARRPLTASMGLICLLTSWALSGKALSLREDVKWIATSRDLKARVLHSVPARSGELRHIEWDEWGFPGAGRMTVYLVADPTDSLLGASKGRFSGRFEGLPCPVARVHWLERHWYAVQFYTDTDWSHCG